jgi:hypothetical protein
MKKFDSTELRKFLVRAKINTYAGEGKEIEPERKDFKELEYSEEDFYYRDSYCGFYRAPGQELVRFKGEPIWAMAYDGGIAEEFYTNELFSKEVYTVLKKALSLINEEIPFRGPEKLEEGDFLYTNEIKGSLESFSGTEKIFYKGKEVFMQNYIGGFILGK